MRNPYRREGDGVVIPVGSVEVSLKEAGDRICGHINDGQIFEEASLAAWASIVEPGFVALDVGVYSGLFSIAAAKLGAHVIGFEPMAEMQERALLNFASNGVSPELYRAAVSDFDGEGQIGYSESVRFTAGASLVRKSGGRRTVKVMRLDSMPFPARVSAIKIDVERNEPAVLRGALGLIERDKPAMIVECLEPALRKEIESIVPGYNVAAVMDTRNLFMLPR